jgi:molybdopterin-containing oxidoreductase family membrane subunit
MSTVEDVPPPSSRELPPPVIEGGHTFATVTDSIASIVLTDDKKRSRWWTIGFLASLALFSCFFIAIGNVLFRGIGVWGINQPAAWGTDIVNFVWWIGIGHAGTLISAVLLLLRQDWRTSINRFAEAMTLFAVACAGMFPIFHVGRTWLLYWIVPYPNTMKLWPNFRSPLLFDLFAISTYALTSFLFWYIGLLPDLATLRDRTESKWGKIFYGMFALGWRGSAKHWNNYEIAYALLAGLATPLVVSVHTIVSYDFALTQVPGWRATIFPPYFVAGAIYAGFAMVLTLALPVRKWFNLYDFITEKHIRNMAKVMLLTGLVVAYGYASEMFMAWYSGNESELYLMKNRFTGPYAPLFWALLVCNVLIPQLLWSKRVRDNTTILFIVAMSINIGMWLERFVIIVISLHRDYMPSAWGMYLPTLYDWLMYVGTIGMFFTLLFLFIKFLPLISIFEVRTLLPAAHAQHADEDEDEDAKEVA